MFFDAVEEIAQIAIKNGTSIFVVPRGVVVEIPQALVLKPETKTTITIEQVREALKGLGLKQVTDRLVVIRPADLLGLEAANALLKNLEEPGDKIHYVLIADNLSKLLPTILSRAAIYILRPESGLSLTIDADEAEKTMAKKLIAAKPVDLVEIAEGIAKKKTARREALRILEVTIEMLYKSYYITGNNLFVKKIPKYLKAYENISKNGHVKLHLVAELC